MHLYFGDARPLEGLHPQHADFVCVACGEIDALLHDPEQTGRWMCCPHPALGTTPLAYLAGGQVALDTVCRLAFQTLAYTH